MLFLPIISMLAASDCSGPFIPPTGYDSSGKPFAMDLEVAVGTESYQALQDRAVLAMRKRVCGDSDCPKPIRLWRTASDGDRKCAFVVTEPGQTEGGIRITKTFNNTSTYNSYVTNQYLGAGGTETVKGTVSAQAAGTSRGPSASQVVGISLASAGLLSGTIAVVSFVDGVDGLYFEPMSPDVTLGAAGLAAALAVVGGTLYFIGSE